MTRLSQLAVSKRSVTLLLAAALFIAGILAWGSLKQELLPDVSFPVVTVVAPFPGAGAADVTEQVAKPIEQAVSGVPGLSSLQSTSANSFAFVLAQFEYGTDLDEATATIEENLRTATLPQTRGADGRLVQLQRRAGRRRVGRRRGRHGPRGSRRDRPHRDHPGAPGASRASRRRTSPAGSRTASSSRSTRWRWPRPASRCSRRSASCRPTTSRSPAASCRPTTPGSRSRRSAGSTPSRRSRTSSSAPAPRSRRRSRQVRRCRVARRPRPCARRPGRPDAGHDRRHRHRRDPEPGHDRLRPDQRPAVGHDLRQQDEHRQHRDRRPGRPGQARRDRSPPSRRDRDRRRSPTSRSSSWSRPRDCCARAASGPSSPSSRSSCSCSTSARRSSPRSASRSRSSPRSCSCRSPGSR